MSWREVLAEEGVTVEAADPARVRLRRDGVDEVFFVRKIPGTVARSQLPVVPDEPALLVVGWASEETVCLAARAGWSVITDAGAARMRLGGHLIERPARPLEGDLPALRRGPAPWGTFAMMRWILVAPAASQKELVRRTGLSQPRVSRVSSELTYMGIVERPPAGWKPTSWEALFGWWMKRYPGPGGTVGYWHSPEEPATQARAALELLVEAGVGRVAVSGDVAAEVLAPGRPPARAVLYAERCVPLDRAGFVPVTTIEEASLVLHAPGDYGVWLPNPWVEQGFPLAEPGQIVYDVLAGACDDREELIGRLRAALEGRHLARWRDSMNLADV